MSGGFSEEEGFSPDPRELEVKQGPRSRMSAGLVVFLWVAAFAVLTYFGIAQGMAALLMFPGIPLVLAWFVYWFFLRRIFRMRRIRTAREQRLMREAALRSRQE